MGTTNGVFRFDGVQFVSWISLSGNKLPSSSVHALLAAKDGSLWIATSDGLLHWANGRSTTYIAGDEINSLLQDSKGNIWATRSGSGPRALPICRIDGSEAHCFGYGASIGEPLAAAVSIAEDAVGNLWIGHDTAVVRWNAAPTRIYRPAALKSHRGIGGIDALAVAADGSVWVGVAVTGREGGLEHVVDGAMKPFTAPKLNGEDLEVNALQIDRQSNLWVGTNTHGIYRIHGSDVDHFDSVEGLSDDCVNRLFEDREGNLWIATTSGLDMLRDLRVTTISKREGLSDNSVQSVLAARDGAVWIGSNHLQAFIHDKVSPELGKGLPGNFVTMMLEDHTGRLWVGMNNTLWIHDGGAKNGIFRQIKRKDGSAIGLVRGLAEDSEHNIWVQTNGPPATLLRIENLEVREEFRAPPLPRAFKIAPDPQNGIWLGPLAGDLVRLRSGKTETFGFSGLQGDVIHALFAAPDGSILGASVSGVEAWKNGVERTLTTRNGLPCDEVDALNADDQGNLWLYAACGLIEVPRDEVERWWQEPEGKLKTKVYDTLDGVVVGESYFSGSSKGPDGRLWFANNSVAQVIDPAHLTQDTVPPPVHINGIVADRKEYPAQEALNLPALTRGLEIDYTAPSFTAPQRVLFRYKLEGHDASWQDAGTRRQAFYNDLPPRKYRFRVIACNSDGVWNEVGASVDFSIRSAWFQTYWFFALCGAAAIFILGALYRMRVRQVAKAMSTRFDERLSERTRIARDLHDTLLQTIQGSKLVADSALKQSTDSCPLRGAMEQLSVWLGRATEEGRTALNSLRTSTTEKNDLAAAFHRVIEECQAQGSMEASFTVIGEVNEMHPIVRDEVYRIGYEAIRNACVHSQATQLQVELTYGDDLVLTVRDNGAGIESSVLSHGKAGHFGLKGMRERAGRIMAKLAVETSTASGTEIKLVVPSSIIYSKTNDGRRKLSALKSIISWMGLTSESTDD